LRADAEEGGGGGGSLFNLAPSDPAAFLLLPSVDDLEDRPIHPRGAESMLLRLERIPSEEDDV